MAQSSAHTSHTRRQTGHRTSTLRETLCHPSVPTGSPPPAATDRHGHRLSTPPTARATGTARQPAAALEGPRSHAHIHPADQRRESTRPSRRRATLPTARLNQDHCPGRSTRSPGGLSGWTAATAHGVHSRYRPKTAQDDPKHVGMRRCHWRVARVHASAAPILTVHQASMLVSVRQPRATLPHAVPITPAATHLAAQSPSAPSGIARTLHTPTG